MTFIWPELLWLLLLIPLLVWGYAWILRRWKRARASSPSSARTKLDRACGACSGRSAWMRSSTPIPT